jgi:hypothetical protein
MNIFLKFRAKQLFFLLVGVPISLQLVSLSLAFVTNTSVFAILTFLLTILIYIGIFIGWFSTVGFNLYNKISNKKGLNLRLFLFGNVYICLYLILFYIAVNYLIGDSNFPNSLAILLLFVLHIYGIFSIFYGMYFVARSLATAEKEQTISTDGFLTYLLLLWIFPIGLWHIQPKINHIFKYGLS